LNPEKAKDMRKYLKWIVVSVLATVGYWVADSLLFDGYRSREITGEGFQAKFFSQPGAKAQPAVVVIGGGPTGDSIRIH